MAQEQYGDFIKGRILFVQQYCREHMMDYNKTIHSIEEETVSRVDSADKKAFLKERLFGGTILPTSTLPNWVDRIFLEAASKVLKGYQCPLFTTTSRIPCIPFEAARFNAKRQADSIFKIMFTGHTVEEWIKWSFPAVYKQCYGEEAAAKLRIVEFNPRHFGVITDNTDLDKASRVDCSTIIGYLYGALEKLGAWNIQVTHDKCMAEAVGGPKVCAFDVRFG